MKINSTHARKQRKALHNYKNHQRSKLLTTRLADFISDEYGIKRIPLRIGDSVKITKGEFRDFEGAVMEITKDLRVKVKECVFEKADGTQFYPKIHVSNLIITKFAQEGAKMDGWRASMIERKAGFLEEGYIAPKKLKERIEKEGEK
jgi:large subunit ribosomal protein L24